MERHLAAIVSADVVSYSTLMREDEVGTLAALKTIRLQIVDPKRRQYRGRSIKLMGDGELFEFPSIVDALTFAVELQLALASRNEQSHTSIPIKFRIGINIGDVIVDGADIYGDGVNLASRIEEKCEPGGVCLSEMARDQIKNQLSLDFENLGKRKFKGFDDKIGVSSVVFNEKAQALRSPIALGEEDNVTEKRPSFFASMPFKVAATAAAMYVGIGGIQYFSQGQSVTKSSLFCPLAKLAKPAPKVKKIGAIMPFEKGFGKRQRWGINRAFRDRADVDQYPVQIILRDSKGDLDETNKHLAEFRQMGVSAILGPMQSRLAYDAKNWGNANQIPVITSLASASYLTGKGVEDYFFRVGMSDLGRANAMIEWLRIKGKHNNPYILHEWKEPAEGVDEPEIYGASQASAVKQGIGQATTLRFTRHDEASQDKVIEQVKNDGRAILIFSYTSNIKRIIGELQNKGVENDIFLMGVVTTTLEEANYPMPEKIHVVTGLVSEAKNLSTTQQLRRIFEDENPGVDYDLSAYYAYDSVNMVLDAMNKARAESCTGHAPGPTIAENLRNTPTKKRRIINTGFLNDSQDILFEFDGLRIINSKFEHVGLTN